MTRKEFVLHVTWIILITLVLIGCGTFASTTASTPSPEPVVEMGEVIYDGTECIVTIPTEIPPGKYSIELKNLTEADVKMWTRRITDGKNFQDLLDLQKEPGDDIQRPDWVADTIEVGSAWDKPDGGEVHTYKFISEGEHFVGVWIYETPSSPLWVVFCAPFWVNESPSE